MDLKQVKAQDVIINHMNDEDHNLAWDISELSRDLDIEYNLCYISCEEMDIVGHIDINIDQPISSEKYPNDKRVNILSAGSVFAKSEDSYESEFLAIIAEQEVNQKEEKLRKRKLDADVKNSEYLVKTQWWPFVIAAISLTVSTYAILKPQSEIRGLKLELKKITDTISSLHLPKTEDLTYKEAFPTKYDTIFQSDSMKTDSLK